MADESNHVKPDEDQIEDVDQLESSFSLTEFECHICKKVFKDSNEVVEIANNIYNYPEQLVNEDVQMFECILCRVSSFEPDSRVIEFM